MAATCPASQNKAGAKPTQHNKAAQQHKPEAPADDSKITLGEQESFSGPEEAAQALVGAVAADDLPLLLVLFGSDGAEILTSGDSTQDKDERAAFVAKARQAMKVKEDPQDSNHSLILIGADEYPFAVPLVESDGQWRFDTPQGKQEMLARRIGSNEIDAMNVCLAYVAAQYKYASEDHADSDGVREYAAKLISTEGKQDGLYWPDSAEGLPGSLADLVTGALEAGYTGKGDEAVTYHGYNFRILSGQGPNAPGGAQDYLVQDLMIGGFGLIAWPAEYGVSGVKTFVVNQEGIVYEKNLGAGTAVSAQAIKTFNPDKSWIALR
ncbi:MAG: DUF2950 domain-containing protein [Acidobacteriaceae bacterium]|nr:DUF2950 domain-containing protein [Acidobacteriaceae bacterium]